MLFNQKCSLVCESVYTNLLPIKKGNIIARSTSHTLSTGSDEAIHYACHCERSEAICLRFLTTFGMTFCSKLLPLSRCSGLRLTLLVARNDTAHMSQHRFILNHHRFNLGSWFNFSFIKLWVVLPSHEPSED